MIKLMLSQWSAICDLEHSSWGMSPLSSPLVVVFPNFSFFLHCKLFPLHSLFLSGRQPAWSRGRSAGSMPAGSFGRFLPSIGPVSFTSQKTVLFWEASKHLKCARSQSGSELVIVGVLSGTAGWISKVLLCSSLTWPFLADGAFSLSLLSIQL